MPTTAPQPVQVDAHAALAPLVRTLLTLGDRWEGGDLRKTNRIDYLARGLAPEHVPDLITLATDTSLWRRGDERTWCAPIHAWRALAQLRAPEAIEPLLGLLNWADANDYDWAYEEVPQVLGMIGEGGVAAALAYAGCEDNREFARIAALNAVKKCLDHHDPALETRALWTAALVHLLEAPARNGAELNGFIISTLMDLRAASAADPIERAFTTGFVDESICGDWPEVRAEILGLPRPPRAPSMMERMLSQFTANPLGLGESDTGFREPPPQPVSRTQSQWSKARKQRDRKRGKRR